MLLSNEEAKLVVEFNIINIIIYFCISWWTNIIFVFILVQCYFVVVELAEFLQQQQIHHDKIKIFFINILNANLFVS